MSHLASFRPEASTADKRWLIEQMQFALQQTQSPPSPQRPQVSATFDSLLGSFADLIDEEFEQCLRDIRRWA